MESNKLITAETAIGYLLRAGVIVSGFFLVLGLALTFVISDKVTMSRVEIWDELRKGQVLPGDVTAVMPLQRMIHLVFQGDPISIIGLGIVLLILLPIVRVGLAALVFLIEKEYVFVIFSLIVLFNLLGGIIFRQLI